MRPRHITAARPLPDRPTPRDWYAIIEDAARTALESGRACVGRVRQRRALSQLDERLLRDIGHDRFAVAQEIAKPFWRR